MIFKILPEIHYKWDIFTSVIKLNLIIYKMNNSSFLFDLFYEEAR